MLVTLAKGMANNITRLRMATHESSQALGENGLQRASHHGRGSVKVASIPRCWQVVLEFLVREHLVESIGTALAGTIAILDHLVAERLHHASKTKHLPSEGTMTIGGSGLRVKEANHVDLQSAADRHCESKKKQRARVE